MKGIENELPDIIQLATDNNISNWDNTKNKIRLRLVNTERNKEMLKTVPHIAMEDLSIVFHLSLKSYGQTEGAYVISNQMFENYGITIEEMYEVAIENMSKHLYIHDLKKVMQDIMFGMESKDAELSLHGDTVIVVSNDEKFYGAATVLIPNVCRRFKQDFYIIPSSVHEVLIMSCDKMSPDELASMIQDVNEKEVSNTDYLSDHAYLYKYDEDRFVMV